MRALILHLEPIETLDSETGLLSNADVDSTMSIVNGCFSANKVKLLQNNFIVEEIDYKALLQKRNQYNNPSP